MPNRYQITVNRIHHGAGIAIRITSNANGACLWDHPGLRWPLSPQGQLELSDAARHAPGATRRLIEAEIRNTLRNQQRGAA